MKNSKGLSCEEHLCFYFKKNLKIIFIKLGWKTVFRELITEICVGTIFLNGFFRIENTKFLFGTMS